MLETGLATGYRVKITGRKHQTPPAVPGVDWCTAGVYYLEAVIVYNE